MAVFRDSLTGGAWLSSARVVRCWVQSRNERNPCFWLPAGYAGHSRETAAVNAEEGGDDGLGYTRATMAGLTAGGEGAILSGSRKPVPVRIAGCNPPA